MKAKSLSLSLVLLLISTTAQAVECDSFTSLKETRKLCWLNSHKLWVSEKCVAPKAKCEALSSLTDKNLKFEKEIFRDHRNNEMVFAVFKDNSMIEVSE
jgi:hypothetical protein